MNAQAGVDAELLMKLLFLGSEASRGVRHGTDVRLINFVAFPAGDDRGAPARQDVLHPVRAVPIRQGDESSWATTTIGVS